MNGSHTLTLQAQRVWHTLVHRGQRWLRLVASLVLCVGSLNLPAPLAAQAAVVPAAFRVGLGGSPCAYDTIGAALLAAANGDTVYISPSTYNEVLGPLSLDLHLTAASADCTTATPAAAPGNYIVDGGGALAVNGGMLNIGANRVVTLTALTLRNADAVDGGILYVSSGANVTLQKTRLFDGSANNRGGLLFVAPLATVLVADGSVLAGGLAGTNGGGLYAEGTVQFNSSSVIRASQAALGGGAALAGAGRLVLNQSNIGETSYGNTASGGGGVYLTGHATLQLDQASAIRWNSATLTHGGGVFATGGVTVTLNDFSRVYGNAANAYGGGLYADNGASLIVGDYSDVGNAQPAGGNTAVRGGGIYADDALVVTVREEAKVRHNNAGDGGGGIYLAGGTPLTMTGGFLTGNQTTGWGGGLAIEVGTAFVWGTVVSGNVAMDGGGVALDTDPDNSFAAVNTQVISNSAGVNGGGISVLGGAAFMVDLDGTSRLAGNHAEGKGGGMYGSGHDTLGLGVNPGGQALRVEGNTATSGGGLYAEGPGLVFILNNVRLTGNSALGDGGGWYQDGGQVIAFGLSASGGPRITGNVSENGRGGGLFLTDVSSGAGDDGAALGNAEVSGNQADADGGGLYIADGSYVRLINSVVADNQAGQDGAGVFVSAATLEMTQDDDTCQNAMLAANHYCSELRGNFTSGNGGGAALEGAAELTLENTAVISNSATLGGGVRSASDGDHLEITNSLFTHNTGKALLLAHEAFLDLVHTTFAANDWAIDIDDNGATANLQNNIIWGNGFGVESALVLLAGCSISQNGVGGTNNDPLFHATGRGDFRLAAGSPAINKCSLGLPADLDGISRPQGGKFDMGAFEAGRSLVLMAPQLDAPEGEAGLSVALVTVSLSEVSTQTITLNVAAVDAVGPDGTPLSIRATAGVDYNPPAASLTFTPGVISQSVALPIVGDTLYEGDEAFVVQLSNAVGAELTVTRTTVLIVDDEALPTLSIAPAEVEEGDSDSALLGVVVSLSHASAFSVTVQFEAENGSALAGTDFEATSGSLTILPGELLGEITLPILGDTVAEPDELLQVTLFGAEGATIAPDAWMTLVTILDNDAAWTVYLPVVLR